MDKACLVLILAACAASAWAQDVRVARWQPQDFEFRSATQHENPFTVSFGARVRGPGGIAFTALGFHDGEGTWKVRLSPTVEGEWQLRTESDDPQLHGHVASLTCVPNANRNVHGGLQVDPNHPRHFVYEDGTRHFLMGYECDWLWALDVEDPELSTMGPFLDKLAAHGFNHVILNAYAHDCGWRRGTTGPDDYGPPPMYAWEGTNEDPDHSRPNLAHWQHYDRVMDALHRRGITAHIMIKVYNKMVNWPAKGGAEDDMYFKWLIARYAAYPNVVWDFSKEAHNEKDLEYKQGRFRLIREHDPYGRPITNHDDNQAYDDGAYDDLLDFRSDQQHGNWHETILRQRQQREWPVVNVEFGYEHGPKGLDDKTYGVVQPPEEVCRRAWEICLAGGYAAYYYTYTAWDVIRPEDTPPGYAYFKRLREFFERTQYWLLEPADDLVSEGYCLANPGAEYVVFLSQAKAFTLKIEGAQRALRANWYHPFSGETADGRQLGNGAAQLTPPAAWGQGPVALWVRA